MATALEAIVAGHVPPGRWAAAVSGGADSVALLELLRCLPGRFLHVAHLDHQTRGGASGDDATFVRALAGRWGLDCTVAVRSAIEADLPRPPANLAARYRAVRIELFRRVIAAQRLDGVVLAHHADDQAETVFQRLLRGSGPAGLTGMAPRTEVAGVVLLRPLLEVHAEALREMLRDRGLAWREDASNASPAQQRNRVRRLLQSCPRLRDPLLSLASSCRRLQDWLQVHSPKLGDEFELEQVRSLAPSLLRHALHEWLQRQSGAQVAVRSSAVERLFQMATDSAAAARWQFAGGVVVRRRAGRMFVQR